MRPLTIGIDGTFLSRDERGMGRAIRSILQTWKNHKTQHRLVLLCQQRRHLGALQSYQEEGWEVMWQGTSPYLDVCWFPWNRIDWETACPRVVFIHDVAPFTQYHPENRHKEQDQARLLQASEQADLVMTNSNFSRTEIHKHLGYPLEDTEVIYLAYDRGLFTPDPNAEAPLPKNLEKHQFMLYIGNLEPRKNLEGLLEGLTLAQKQVTMPLALVSPRPTSSWTDRLRGKFNSLVELSHALEDQLVWIDRVDDQTLVNLYRQTRLFVMPSLYEGFGLPLLEAMACGCPVAAGRASSLPEVGGPVPAWFNPKDPVDIARVLIECLEKPIPDPAPALEQARHFDWEETANEVMALLEQAAERPYRSSASGSVPILNLDDHQLE